MHLINAMPEGELYDTFAMIDLKRTGLDGCSTVSEVQVALTPYAVNALMALLVRLQQEHQARQEPDVTEIRQRA